jgi:hypothetical protein
MSRINGVLLLVGGVLIVLATLSLPIFPITLHARWTSLDIWILPLGALALFFTLVYAAILVPRWWQKLPILVCAIPTALLVPFLLLSASFSITEARGSGHSDLELLDSVVTSDGWSYSLYYCHNGMLVSDTLTLRKENVFGPFIARKSLWWLTDGPASARLFRSTSGHISIEDGSSVLGGVEDGV